METTAQQLANEVNGKLIGQPKKTINQAANMGQAGPEDLAFLEDLPTGESLAALFPKAGCLLVPRKLEQTILASTEKQKFDTAFILVDQPKLAFAKLLSKFWAEKSARPGIHATAIVAASAKLGRDISIGAYAVIGEDCEIGDESVIRENCSLAARSTLGQRVILHPGVVLYRGVEIGDRSIIHAGAVLGSDGFGYVMDQGRYQKFPQIGRLVIECDVEIGANTCIDRAALHETRIRQGTKIDNLVQIAHNVEVGEHCTMSAQSGIAGSSKLGNYVVLAGQSGIGDYCELQDQVIVGAKSAVITGKLVPSGQVVWGIPARPLAKAKKQVAAVSRLDRALQELDRLKRKVAALEGSLNQQSTGDG